MALTVADLAHHIVTLRRLHSRVLEAEFELLRRVYGESVVEEALRLVDEAVQRKQTPQAPSAGHTEIGDALDRMMAEPSSK